MLIWLNGLGRLKAQDLTMTDFKQQAWTVRYPIKFILVFIQVHFPRLAVFPPCKFGLDQSSKPYMDYCAVHTVSIDSDKNVDLRIRTNPRNH